MNKVDSDFNTAACYHFDHKPHDSCISFTACNQYLTKALSLRLAVTTVSLLPVLCTINHEYVALYYIILLMVRTPEINCFSVMYNNYYYIVLPCHVKVCKLYKGRSVHGPVIFIECTSWQKSVKRR